MTLYIILQPEAQIELISNQSPSALASTSHKYSVTSNGGSSPVSSKFTYSTPLPNSSPEIANRMSAYSSSFNRTEKSINSRSQPALSRSQSINLNSIRLSHIFKNDDTFKLFIRHLAKEYCIENALFLFESQQFKKQCNDIEAKMTTINSRHSKSDISMNIHHETNPSKAVARISSSKSQSSMNSRRGIYSKKPRNLLSGLFVMFSFIFVCVCCALFVKIVLQHNIDKIWRLHVFCYFGTAHVISSEYIVCYVSNCDLHEIYSANYSE